VIKVKLSHYRPLGIQEVEAAEFIDTSHIKVLKLSALRTGRLYSQEISLVLISARGSEFFVFHFAIQKCKDFIYTEI
jgi:hypothetical protein